MRAATTRPLRILGAAVITVTASLAAGLVLFPDGWTVNRLNVRIWSFLVFDLGLPTSITPGDMEVFWNVVMFVPLGLSLTLIRPSWWWILALSALSAAVETAQLLILTGRSADPLDWAANSLGAGLGVLLAYVVLRLTVSRSPRRHDETGE